MCDQRRRYGEDTAVCSLIGTELIMNITYAKETCGGVIDQREGECKTRVTNIKNYY